VNGAFFLDDMTSWLSAEAHFKRYNEPTRAIPTPFPTLNSSCRGFAAGQGLSLGWYVVMGGDTGQGKSLLALQMGVEGLKAGYRPAFISLEMSVHELRNRFYSQMIGIPARDLEPGPMFKPSARKQVMDWADSWNSEKGFAPFFVSDQAGPSLASVVQQMDFWREEHGASMYIVDYLQLMEEPTAVGSAQEVMKISQAMREYAHRHEVVVIGLSQYNNEGGNDRTRPPHVGSLYGGRRISQDSDLTILLDHSRYERDPMDRHIARTYLMVPKNRHGPSGHEIPIQWDYRYLTAREAMPDEERLWPRKL
jgi:replicative DNA helicase